MERTLAAPDEDWDQRLRRAAPHMVAAVQAFMKLRQTGEIAELDVELSRGSTARSEQVEALRSQIALLRETGDLHHAAADHLDQAVRILAGDP